MATGSPFFDGLFSGFAYLQVGRAPVDFAKTLNLSTAFTATYNAATNSIDIAIASPSIEVPISADGVDVIVGADPSNGIPGHFYVPNDDGSGYALDVDNSAALTKSLWGVRAPFFVATSVSALTTPPSGQSYIYMDSADNLMKIKGPGGGVTVLVDKMFFGADALVGLTAVASIVPPGSRALTLISSGAAIPGCLCPTAGSFVVFRARHTGDAANVGGQTVTYRLLKNGSAITGATVALPANAGVNSSAAIFTVASFASGDVITSDATPSALLTASVTNITTSAG